MAPTLRDKTKQKTQASADAATAAGFVQKPRKPPSRRQLYIHNRGLINLQSPPELQAM